jgi:geranylgeranyl reductase family protein
MQTWDVIVVGAGPAGCGAGYDLATSGRSVLLLDRCTFPRQKACAGGLTIKAVRALRYSIEPVVRETISSIRVSKHLVLPCVLKSPRPLCVMTVREELDAFCLNKTLEAGAKFRLIKSIRGVKETTSNVILTTDIGEFEARFLVGADGANSQVRQFCGNPDWFRKAFALEAQVRCSGEPQGLGLDFGVVRNGYGWVFPKGDHLNVGLCAESPEENQKVTRATLSAYIRRRLNTETFDRVVGQYLGIGGWLDNSVPRRVFLTGDAAGLVDPLTGEGIYNAIVSGQEAAKAIESGLSGNEAAGELFAAGLSEMRRDLAIAARMSQRFYNNLDWGYAALTFPVVRRAALKTYSNGLNFVRALKRYDFVRPYLSLRTYVAAAGDREGR